MNIENKIDEIFFELGMPVHQLGYDYAKVAIRNCIEGKSSYHNMMKLYNSVAKPFNTTCTRTERAIRHSIETVWNKSVQSSVEYKYFGNCISPDSGKPSNTQFIAGIVRYIQNQM